MSRRKIPYDTLIQREGYTPEIVAIDSTNKETISELITQSNSISNSFIYLVSDTSDVEGARAAGIDQMWFRRVTEGEDDPNYGKVVTLTEGQTATYIVNSYRQITDILADGKWVA